MKYFRLLFGWLYRPIRAWLQYARLITYHKIVIPRLIARYSKKRCLKVVFLAMKPALWKYDGVFQRMLKDSRFCPIVFTAMRKNISRDEQLVDQKEMVDFFGNKGYEIRKGLNDLTGEWDDVMTMKPDIVFYTQPYGDNIMPIYDVRRVARRALIGYTPYYYPDTDDVIEYTSPVHLWAWKFYVANDECVRNAIKHSPIRDSNIVVAGYSLKEELSDSPSCKKRAEDVWRHDKRKRIIWAPHHSITSNELFPMSTFLDICDDMLSIRNEFKREIVIAFKPHPVLKAKLYRIWGKDATDTYYSNWVTGENSFLTDGEYIELFAGSDALIHDCGSFVIEYMYTQKPSLYMLRKMRESKESGIGLEALNLHYHGRGAMDVRNFLKQVVIDGEDKKKKDRVAFGSKYLMNINNKSFSENVLTDMKNSLGYNSESV